MGLHLHASGSGQESRWGPLYSEHQYLRLYIKLTNKKIYFVLQKVLEVQICIKNSQPCGRSRVPLVGAVSVFLLHSSLLLLPTCGPTLPMGSCQTHCVLRIQCHACSHKPLPLAILWGRDRHSGGLLPYQADEPGERVQQALGAASWSMDQEVLGPLVLGVWPRKR